MDSWNDVSGEWLGERESGFLFFLSFLLLLCLYVFLGLHLRHMEVPTLGVKSQQHQILNPLSEARDGTRILMDTLSGFQPAELQWELPGKFLYLWCPNSYAK